MDFRLSGAQRCVHMLPVIGCSERRELTCQTATEAGMQVAGRPCPRQSMFTTGLCTACTCTAQGGTRPARPHLQYLCAAACATLCGWGKPP